MEAEDIDLHLRTLRRPIAAFEERSFTDLEPLIPALFHTLALIWTNSHFYCRPPRIVTLLTEFCNLLIDKVLLFVCLCEFLLTSYLNYFVWCEVYIMCVCVHMVLQASVYLIPEELFKMELEEGMDRVRKAIQVFWTFKRSFQQHRDKLTPTGPYSRPGLTVKPWDFPSELVFHRTDCIMERLRMIEVCVHKSIPTEKSSVYNLVFFWSWLWRKKKKNHEKSKCLSQETSMTRL